MLSLPSFSDCNVEHFSEYLVSLLNQNRVAIDELLNQTTFTWQSLMQPLDDLDDVLSQRWSPVSHMHSVVNNDVLRKTYQSCVAELSQYGTEVGQNKKLYDAIKSLPQGTDVENKIIEDELKSFELSGVDLAGKEKERFKEIQARLSELSTQFENNLLDATSAWKKNVHDIALLKGIPEHAINAAWEKGEKDHWVLTLDFPCFHAVMTYAEDASLRKEMHHAYTTRASELGSDKGKFDNSDKIDEILTLRHDKALLLGFNNYAELSLSKKMAPSTEKVMAFLHELCDKGLKQAQEEFKSLEIFSEKSLNPWDLAFYSEKQREAQYAISQEALRPYFPENKVLHGMFKIVTRLYGIELQEKKDVDVWHKDVRFFEIVNDKKDVTGGLYIDLYAREHKRGGAWMDECVPFRRLTSDKIQRPVAYLTCNFAPPSGGREACFSHDEVITLFHEFGHCLHHLMSRVPYLSASGINGVEWDAVELPSQFFENWCWHKDALSLISEHVETKDCLPDEMFEKLTRARNFQSAMGMMRQLEFSLFDFSIHLNYNKKAPVAILNALEAIREKYAVVPVNHDNRFPHGFSHIFAGGYGAGYYSYKWAEVLSSDAFARFEEEGIFSAETGKAFLEEILSMGSSRKALASFIAFRGREPEVAALLRHNGIKT